jgi:nucleoside-diphosphate-sugar epimerase
MEGAKGHLKFFEMDLLNSDSIAAAVKGCAGVIHLACPNIIGEVKDPEVPKSKLLNILSNFILLTLINLLVVTF